MKHKKIYRLLPFRLFLAQVLKGSKYRCNVCRKTFDQFLSLQEETRVNEICPSCHSDAAQRTLWFYLKSEVIGKKNKNHFLFVKGPGSLLKYVDARASTLNVVDQDYFSGKNIHNGEKLEGGKYDVIIFSHVLQYLNDDDAVLKELRRLLRQGGFILLQTIVNSEMDRTYENIANEDDKDRLKNYYEPGVRSVYGANIHKHLDKAGFEVEVVDYPFQLGPAAADYYRLGDGKRELIFKCKKL